MSSRCVSHFSYIHYRHRKDIHLNRRCNRKPPGCNQTPPGSFCTRASPTHANCDKTAYDSFASECPPISNAYQSKSSTHPSRPGRRMRLPRTPCRATRALPILRRPHLPHVHPQPKPRISIRIPQISNALTHPRLPISPSIHLLGTRRPAHERRKWPHPMRLRCRPPQPGPVPRSGY